MFTVAERNRVRDRIVEIASADARIAAAALVGSLTDGGGDEWSDLDLTFAVADDADVVDVLADWTRTVAGEFDGVPLFDLPVRSTIYRVFLLPGALQVDLSFTPAADFRGAAAGFELLFGEALPPVPSSPPRADELFGWAVVFALTARKCIERRRWWQAEYSINAVRDNVLSIACLRHGLPSRYGKGFDQLPAEVLARFDDARARSLDPDELLRALSSAIDGLLRECDDDPGVPPVVARGLRELASGRAHRRSANKPAQ